MPNQISNSINLRDGFFVEFHTESLFYGHDNLNTIERISAQIAPKRLPG